MKEMFNYKTNINSYFKSKGDMYIFALLYLDAEIRMNMIGISLGHYKNKDIATQWRDNIRNEIMLTSNSEKELALNKLEKIYLCMIE